VGEHQPGGGPRARGAFGRHADAHVRLADGRRVVGTVAGHGHYLAGPVTGACAAVLLAFALRGTPTRTEQHAATGR
jgi:hypothetical protein